MKRQGAPLGQHFLTAAWAAQKLISAAHITDEDTVVEIGPGKGALTRELLTEAGKVIAVEKDPELVAHLQEAFAEEIAGGQLVIVEDDVRNISSEEIVQGTSYKLVANIPYYITGEIIRTFLTAQQQPRHMALLIQKEVADRIVSEKESLLSLSVKAYGTPRRVSVVGKKNFRPAPQVDSAILVVTDISRAFFDTISEDAFFTLLHKGFAAKRKMLASNLREVYGKDTSESALAHCDIAQKERAENVPLAKWKCLTQTLN